MPPQKHDDSKSPGIRDPRQPIDVMVEPYLHESLIHIDAEITAEPVRAKRG